MADNRFAPRISPENTTPATSTMGAEVDAFLAKMRDLSTQPAANGGRLIFALDATASRQPTWDTACQLQAEMFREATAIGSLSVQLVYYRGLSECRASRWVSQPEQLSGLMERIDCHIRGEPGQAQPRRRQAWDVEQVFRGIARLTHGAYCRFDAGAACQLAELLRAVAVYAAGGMTALAARRDMGAVKLLSQMK
jgi:hypothetical protein